MTGDQKVEIAAEAMFHNRFGDHKGSWDRFKVNHPDVAAVYQENARVAIDAIDRALTEHPTIQ